MKDKELLHRTGAQQPGQAAAGAGTPTPKQIGPDPHLLSDERAAVKNDLSDTERALGATHSALSALASAWLTLPVGGGSMDLQGQ